MERIYDFFFSLFGPLCHQITERSFQSFDGKQFFVCARDTGTYFGFLFSFVFTFLFNRVTKTRFKIPIITSTILFFLHLGMFGIDGVSSYAGWRETNNFIRYFTGFYLGFFLGLIFQYVEFFLRDKVLSLQEKNSPLNIFKNLIILELSSTLFFFPTLLSIKYLLYLLPISVVFYIYMLFRLISDLVFFKYKNFYYYLILFIVFLLIIGSILIAGLHKINLVHKLYH